MFLRVNAFHSRYNARVFLRSSIAAVLLCATALAQSSPAPCPADRPVDEIIAELARQQSKKNSRNKNPLPDSICIFGWCRKGKTTPPSSPEPAAPVETPSSGNASSSQTDTDRCNDAMDRALDAAHNVDVGDTYFQKENYRGAQLRYQDAVDEKPADAAIHVRLGRAFEKLNDPAHALEHYQAAEKLPGPEKWTHEAHAAIARLQPTAH